MTRVDGGRRSPRPRRRFGAILALSAALAVGLLPALAVGLVPALAPAPVLAARPDLGIVSATTYDVRPDEGRVAVSVRLTATNHLKDTVARRFYFRIAVLTVLPGASAFKITGGPGTPKVSVSDETETYTNLRIDLGSNLAAGKSTTLTLTFDLRDPGGAADRPVRISPSLVTFAAWAFATPETPGSSVAVRFPASYRVSVERGPLVGPEPEDETHQRWSSGPLEAPLEFVADVAADGQAAYAETSRDVALADGQATILLRSWPDDPGWSARIGDLVERALPVLEAEIGLPWPVDGPLAVQEALVRGSGGFAGLFDPAEQRIEIAYAAPDVVVLHELAHAWFNGGLVADRWAAEAFASYYADLAAAELGIAATPPIAADPDAEEIPLNAWGQSGTESPSVEAFAYGASLELARAIAERAGPERLREMWAVASRGVGAYGLDPAVEGDPAGPLDWRGLLDLLEERTDATYVDLWREWVARPGDLGPLSDRAVVRASYLKTASRAGEWQLPPSVRDAMRAWQFDTGRDLLMAADAVLDQRDALAASAEAAGLTLPDRLRLAFEGPGGPSAAEEEARAEQTTVDAIVAATNARTSGESGAGQLVASIGLLGSEPDVQVAAAASSLATGDLPFAFAAAQTAEGLWKNAANVGRSRIVSAALLLAALLLLAGLIRRERRRRSAKAT